MLPTTLPCGARTFLDDGCPTPRSPGRLIRSGAYPGGTARVAPETGPPSLQGVLILLPPSEGKHSPVRGRSLDLDALAFPELSGARSSLLDELVRRCRDDPRSMQQVLGLGPTQADEITRNGLLREAPTARADAVYTGVLFESLDLSSLSTPGRRRAARRLLISSALFGVVRPSDRIPAYRLAGGVRLPDHGGVARYWSRHLAGPLDEAAAGHLVVDLRSSTYVPFWRPSRRRGLVAVRVLQEEEEGRRSVVSHFNKATKGELARALLEDGAAPRTGDELAEHIRGLGWRVEPSGPAGSTARLDVVVTSLG